MAPAMIAPASEAPSGSRVMRLGMPSWTPKSTYDDPPTWKSGIATRLTSPSSNTQPSWAFTVWASMLACESITPLGWPVVPEEYMTSTTSSGVTVGRRGRSGVAAASSASYSSPGAPSGVTSTTRSTRGSRSRSFSTSGISSLPTSSIREPASLTA